MEGGWEHGRRQFYWPNGKDYYHPSFKSGWVIINNDEIGFWIFGFYLLGQAKVGS